MSTQPVTFGNRLRSLRHIAGFSVAELARAAVLTENAIYRLEAGDRTRPRADTLVALAGALDVSADELLGLDRDNHQETHMQIGELVELRVLMTAGDVMSGDKTMLVPDIALPDQIDHSRLAVVIASDFITAPDLQPDDIAIIALDHPWSDGDLLAVPDPSGTLVIRRCYHEGDAVLVVGADLSDRRTITATAVIGRVMRSIRSH